MYKSKLDLMETEVAIKFIKDTFERKLAKKLNLTRVSAPLMVEPETGLNDNLNGHERRVSFTASNLNVEIVQSLAKWKRMALAKYHFQPESGLYTDMNAIRCDEEMDNIHSIYVDQWDWEKIITKEERNFDFLQKTVEEIYSVVYKLGVLMHKKYPIFSYDLPKKITFISTHELEERYPNLSRKEREKAIAKEYKAVFLYQIGWPLKDGYSHDGRAADYDDWLLNGDILLWYDILEIAFEISSMGIRVDEDSLVKQLEFKNELEKISNPYCQSVLNRKLPYTIGGGIGQSRLCMFFLQKMHIGEVHASVWTKELLNELAKENIHLL